MRLGELPLYDNSPDAPLTEDRGPYGVSFRPRFKPLDKHWNSEDYLARAKDWQGQLDRNRRALLDRLENCRNSTIDYLHPTMPPVEAYEFAIVGKRSDLRVWCLTSTPMPNWTRYDRWGEPEANWHWWPPREPGLVWHAQQVCR